MVFPQFPQNMLIVVLISISDRAMLVFNFLSMCILRLAVNNIQEISNTANDELDLWYLVSGVHRS